MNDVYLQRKLKDEKKMQTSIHRYHDGKKRNKEVNVATVSYVLHINLLFGCTYYRKTLRALTDGYNQKIPTTPCPFW